MKKTDRKTKEIKKFKKEKSTRIVNAITFILVSSLILFAWLHEIKKYNISDLIKIAGNLVSYDYRKPGDRGIGYEGKVLFVRLNKYDTEFRLHIDYDLFVHETGKSKTTEIVTYIEPKYKKFLFDTNGDVETIGLQINNSTFDIPEKSLKKRNWGMTYGVPVITVVLLILGINEIVKVRGLIKNQKSKHQPLIE